MFSQLDSDIDIQESSISCRENDQDYEYCIERGFYLLDSLIANHSLHLLCFTWAKLESYNPTQLPNYQPSSLFTHQKSILAKFHQNYHLQSINQSEDAKSLHRKKSQQQISLQRQSKPHPFLNYSSHSQRAKTQSKKDSILKIIVEKLQKRKISFIESPQKVPLKHNIEKKLDNLQAYLQKIRAERRRKQSPIVIFQQKQIHQQIQRDFPQTKQIELNLSKNRQLLQQIQCLKKEIILVRSSVQAEYSEVRRNNEEFLRMLGEKQKVSHSQAILTHSMPQVESSPAIPFNPFRSQMQDRNMAMRMQPQEERSKRGMGQAASEGPSHRMNTMIRFTNGSIQHSIPHWPKQNANHINHRAIHHHPNQTTQPAFTFTEPSFRP